MSVALRTVTVFHRRHSPAEEHEHESTDISLIMLIAIPPKAYRINHYRQTDRQTATWSFETHDPLARQKFPKEDKAVFLLR